jgi:PE-PPE domain
MASSAWTALRRGGGTLLAVVGTASVALIPAMAPPHAVAASALVMGGTDQPRPAELGDYMPRVEQYFLDPMTSCKVATCRLEPVDYPAEFYPFPQWGGLEALTYDHSVADGVVSLSAALQNELTSRAGEPIAMFGSSQSATVLTIVKRSLATASPEEKDLLEIVLIANPNRPNGGLLSRFSPLSILPIGFTANGATPTDTGIKTTDIAFQYDIAADFPRYPLNLFALLNSFIGMDIHGSYTVTRNGYTELELLQAIEDPANRQTFGDTTYITIPTKDLPLVQPIRQFGVAQGISDITEPLVALIEPTLRVLVELGYDRSVEYGRPTSGALFPRIDPGKLVFDLADAVRTGLADAGAEIAATPRSSTQPDPELQAAEPATDEETTLKPERHKGFTFHRQEDATEETPEPGWSQRHETTEQTSPDADTEPEPEAEPAEDTTAAADDTVPDPGTETESEPPAADTGTAA